MGFVRFADNAGNLYAEIRGQTDAAGGSNDYPGRLTFFVTADGASSPTERMRIDSSGRVGIGTSSPNSVLQVNSGTNLGGILIGFNAGSSNFYDADLQVFRSGNGTERARIDSSGRLLVGTSSARTGSIGGNNQVVFEAGSTYLNTILASNVNSSDGNFLSFIKSRGASTGSHTIVQSGDNLGVLSFEGADGSVSRAAAQILAQVDGTPGASDMPGRLVFSTTADGAASPTAGLRIANNRQVDIYTNGGSGVWVATQRAASTSDQVFYASYGATAFQTGTLSFLVYTNGNVANANNSYGATSDIKLKENIVDAGSQWGDLKALQVRKYNFKEGQTHTQIGLVAQEVELVSPGLVTESPDRNEDGNDLGTVTKSVNYSVLYMKAVKALQEAMERIEQLEADVALLKGA